MMGYPRSCIKSYPGWMGVRSCDTTFCLDVRKGYYINLQRSPYHIVIRDFIFSGIILHSVMSLHNQQGRATIDIDKSECEVLKIRKNVSDW
jgi:hypothetical protein